MVASASHIAAEREVALADAIQTARAADASERADALCWELALTVRRGVSAEIRSLSGWRRATMERDELVSVGLLGAFKAAAKFDPRRGRFTTYARLWIRAELRRQTGEQAGLIRLPENAQGVLRAIRAAERQGLGADAIAVELRRELAEVLELLAVATPALRLDAPTEAGEIRDRTPDPHPAADHILQAAEEHRALSAAITAVLADPATDSLVRWHLLMNPADVRDPVALAALRVALESHR